MADDPKDDDPHNSFTDTGFGVGQNADGSFNIFPASELAERAAARDREEEATAYAMKQSGEGFPADEDDVGDLEDLTGVVDLFGAG